MAVPKANPYNRNLDFLMRIERPKDRNVVTLMDIFTHKTIVPKNFEAELRGTNPGEIRISKFSYSFLVTSNSREPAVLILV